MGKFGNDPLDDWPSDNVTENDKKGFGLLIAVIVAIFLGWNCLKFFGII